MQRVNIVGLYKTHEIFRVGTKDGERESSRRRNKYGKLEENRDKSHI